MLCSWKTEEKIFYSCTFNWQNTLEQRWDDFFFIGPFTLVCFVSFSKYNSNKSVYASWKSGVHRLRVARSQQYFQPNYISKNNITKRFKTCPKCLGIGKRKRFVFSFPQSLCGKKFTSVHINVFICNIYIMLFFIHFIASYRHYPPRKTLSFLRSLLLILGSINHCLHLHIPFVYHST